MSKPKILYVDDEELNLMLFGINFEKAFEVYTAQNGQEGLRILNSNPDISLVISDMKMPGMDGLEFIRNARENNPGKTYFILTGFEITAALRDALDTGLISNCFRKPFNLVELKEAFQLALSKS
ncbi:MAG: response regulator [Bacteroidota bacterium]